MYLRKMAVSSVVLRREYGYNVVNRNNNKKDIVSKRFAMKNERDEKLRVYMEASPDIIKYQLATKLILTVWLFLLGRLLRLLLNSTGRVAVTSGDFTFLFGTWQGILMILIVIISLFVYVALDLGSKIVLSENLLLQRISCLRFSVHMIHLKNPLGNPYFLSLTLALI